MSTQLQVFINNVEDPDIIPKDIDKNLNDNSFIFFFPKFLNREIQLGVRVKIMKGSNTLIEGIIEKVNWRFSPDKTYISGTLKHM